MKIAIVLDSIARAGAERQAIYTVRELAGCGHDVELLYYHQCEYEYDLTGLGDARVQFLPKSGSYLRFLLRLRGHLRGGQFDVVHAFKSTPCIYGCLAAWLAKVPVIVAGYRVEYDDRGLIRLGHRLVNRVASACVVNSNAIAASVVSAIRTPREKFFVVYNGIDTNQITSDLSVSDARKRLGIDSSCHVVSIFARLRPQKNHEMFIRMAAGVLQSLPETRFLVVGDGERFESTRSLAESLGINNQVLFLGNRSDIADLLAATDVSVLTSHYEGLSNTLLEAMAVGVPIVTTDYAGVEEAVTDGREGFIVPRRDDDAMAAKVVQLLNDESLRKRMGESGRKRVEKQFSLEAMTDSLLAVYESSLSKVHQTR